MTLIPLDATAYAPETSFLPSAQSMPSSPEKTRDVLLKQLDERCDRIKLYDAYYRGQHRLAYSSDKFRSAFGRLFANFADNWCPIVVDAVDERLNVEGFRFPQAGGDDPLAADRDAWKVWQANDLDAYSQIAHVEALINEESYALVAPPKGGDDYPTITIEHAAQVYVARSASAQRVRLAAVKRWIDDDSFANCTLYTPSLIYKWRSEGRVGQATGYYATVRWVPRIPNGETWPARNPVGVVPFVPLVNRPRLLTFGESELTSVVPIQDAVNKMISDMLVASEFGAFRQRWVTGREIEVDPQTNQPKEPPWKPAVDRLWLEENPDAHFGEFSESDLGNYVKAIETLIQHIASQTRTPPHYFYLSGQFPSGESIKSAEAGLVAKANRKMRHFGESWEEVIRLAFKLMNDPRADAYDAETVWRDPEYRTEGEHVDALLKLKTIGIPDEQLWADAGYTPQQIERFLEMRKRAAAEMPQPPNGAMPFGAQPAGAMPTNALPMPSGAMPGGPTNGA